MNAAWGGLSEENEISICISPDHKTTENILKSGAFTVSMADAAHVKECDYVGVVSGNKVPDKMEKAGFHTVKSEFVNAPIIEELPIAVECILKSYDEENCRLVGEIVNVSVSEEFLDEKGKVDVKKMRPITYDPINHEYLVLGEKAGNAFKDGLTI
jgi:flavin reductase (DIM6/NTAB) family NADH-FMN oxidoreductase RutF